MSNARFIFSVKRSLYEFLEKENMSVSQFAQKLNMSRGSLYAKLAGRRGWRIDELERLAELGVRVPSFNQPRGGEGRA